MKLTKTKLKQLIKEELKAMLDVQKREWPKVEWSEKEAVKFGPPTPEAAAAADKKAKESARRKAILKARKQAEREKFEKTIEYKCSQREGNWWVDVKTGECVQV